MLMAGKGTSVTLTVSKVVLRGWFSASSKFCWIIMTATVKAIARNTDQIMLVKQWLVLAKYENPWILVFSAKLFNSLKTEGIIAFNKSTNSPSNWNMWSCRLCTNPITNSIHWRWRCYLELTTKQLRHSVHWLEALNVISDGLWNDDNGEPVMLMSSNINREILTLTFNEELGGRNKENIVFTDGRSVEEINEI